MPKDMKYDAFISYRHLPFDKEVAIKLQKKLEAYRPPKALRGKGFKRFRVFRDETELSTSNSLSDSIREALRNTRYLVVICSEGTAQSRWCLEEIQYFKELHGGSTDHIRVIVIEGDPHKVLPEELLTEARTSVSADGTKTTETVDVEPLALNIVAETHKKSLKKLNLEYLRIAATLLGHGFEDLYRRNQRRKLRNGALLGSTVGALLVGIIIYGSVLLMYARQQEQLALENLDLATEQTALAEENLAQAKSLLVSSALDYAADLNNNGARERSAAILQFLYEHIEEDWDNYDELMVKFRDVALGAVHYSANSLQAFVEGDDSISDIFFLPGGQDAVVVSSRRVRTVRAATGEVLGEYAPPGDALFASCAMVEDSLLCGLNDGGLVQVDLADGTSEVFKEVLPYAIERIAWREEQGTLLLLGTQRVMVDNRDYIYLTIVPHTNGAFDPALPGAQTFELESDVRGDLSDPYSFSGNGRFLATKKNITITVEGSDRLYDTDNKDVLVLDTDAFNAGQSAETNRTAMLHTVNTDFDLDDVYLTTRYSIDNDGLLFLDLQTALYDGTSELGYMTGYTLENQQHLQQIVVYDVQRTEVLFSQDLLEDGDAVYSTFVPVPDALGYLPYVRYNGEDGASVFAVYRLEEEEDAVLKAEYSRDLPDGICGEEIRGIALQEGTMFSQPGYALAVNTVSGGSRLYVVESFSAVAEMPPRKGFCGALASDGTADGLWAAGFEDGMLHCYTLHDSFEEVPSETPYVNDYDKEVMLGDTPTGTMIAYSEEASLSVIEYNEDRSRMFGFINSGEDSTDPKTGYYVWDMATGETVQKVEGLGDSYSRGDVAISGDFTVAVARERLYFPQYEELYTFWNLETGEAEHEYVTGKKYDYYGFGRTPRELWFVEAEAGVVETINTETQAVEKREFVRNHDISALSVKVYYNPDNDYIVFSERANLSGGNYVYSFSSQQVVLDYLDILSVNKDCTLLYLDNAGTPVSLLPEDLYQQLLQRPHKGEIFAEDEAVVGVEIL